MAFINIEVPDADVARVEAALNEYFAADTPFGLPEATTKLKSILEFWVAEGEEKAAVKVAKAAKPPRWKSGQV